MKKTAKKLKLAKETVKALGETDLSNAQGGSNYVSFCVCGSVLRPCFATEQPSCRC